MEKRIFKYEINTSLHGDKTDIHLPIDAKLLYINYQHNERAVQAWFEVDENNDYEKRTFYAMYTGFKFNNDNLRFFQSVVFPNESFVVHIYEEIEDFIKNEEMEI